jgi:Transglycosylase SLT domain
MHTPRVHSWLTRASVAAVLLALIGARDVRAAKRKPPPVPPPPPVLRFPDSPSDTLISELTRAGRVSAALPPEPEEWRRWGRAVPEDQDLSVRAIADALAKAHLPIDLSAMILAIARVESGFNPFSEHPVSTACGLFQFVEGTWEHYQPTRDTCFDPYVNAWAGVRHLSMLDSGRLRDARKLLQGVPDEVQRTEYLYRLLYAYHYHGSRSLYAALGGSLTAQEAADSGVPYLKRYYSILKKATYVPPPPPAKKPVVRRARAGSRGAHGGAHRHRR